MRRAFATSGQLPALLLSLRLMGQAVIHTSLEVTGPAGADDAARPQAGAPNTAVAHGRRLLKGGGGGGGQHNGGHYHRLANGATLHNGSKHTTAKPAGGKAYSKAAAAAAAAAAASPSDLQLLSVTVHTARCRVTYTSMLLRSDPSEKVRSRRRGGARNRCCMSPAVMLPSLAAIAMPPVLVPPPHSFCSRLQLTLKCPPSRIPTPPLPHDSHLLLPTST